MLGHLENLAPDRTTLVVGQVDQLTIHAEVEGIDDPPAVPVQHPTVDDVEVRRLHQQESGTLGDAAVLEPGTAGGTRGQHSTDRRRGPPDRGRLV